MRRIDDRTKADDIAVDGSRMADRSETGKEQPGKDRARWALRSLAGSAKDPKSRKSDETADKNMAEPRSGRGELERAEQALRFDGIVTRWETYEAGALETVREDTNGDGQPDKWETWVSGALAEVALDTRGLGKADRKIVYPADGSAPRMLVDAGDGTFTPLTTAP